MKLKKDAERIADKQEVLSSGESFYITLGDKNFVSLGHSNVIPLSSTRGFRVVLWKAKAEEGIIDSPKLDKPSSTFVVYDGGIDNYKIIFDTLE